ncbi:hypothetical protein SLS60_002992 [Paraconiothyrium brasiliense]|uniref:Amidase domain-containing protein n=1 Tax=Paraconiothyrium brasiliense TaxID=300254 RepID=A0ABR3RUX0_9PLEO
MFGLPIGLNTPQVSGLKEVLAAVFIGWVQQLTFPCLAYKPAYRSVRQVSIEDFQKDLKNGLYTSVNLVRTFLARIDEVNQVTHVVAEINPNAIHIARELDLERITTGPRSILHGIPILVKDSISAEGMNNTAGSCCLVGARTKVEASVIARLRKAGAIILDKTNMSQWGNGRSSGDNASNGWSSWGGQTYGVYVKGQDPCGSSSGSASSMAMGLAAAAVGVETVGSITCPAMKSNIVSIKPTAALVAKDSVIVAKFRGAVGPMASTVKDAATLLGFMAGKSENDSLTKGIPFDRIPDYVESCNSSSLNGARIGIPRNGLKNPIGTNINTKPIMKAFEKAISLMQSHGATLIDNANYPNWDEVYEKSPQSIVSPSEYARDMAAYFHELSDNPHNIHGVEDMISCTKKLPMEEYPSRNVANFEAALKAPAFDSTEVLAAWKRMKYLGAEGGIDGALDATKADALILPSIICSDIPGLVGYPTITVPMGYLPNDTPITKNPRGDLIDEAPNVPFGLCFIGRAYSEQKLIGLAYAFEQLTRISTQKKPVVLPKTELLNAYIHYNREKILSARGEFDEALKEHFIGLEIRKKVLGDHVQTAGSCYRTAVVMDLTGKHAEAM